MIQKLSIRNFKSIRELDLDCRRVNVLIGEPNKGKTNLLEALSLLDLETLNELSAALRVTSLAQLHWNNDPSSTVSIIADKRKILFEYSNEYWWLSEKIGAKEESIAKLNWISDRSLCHNKWPDWNDLTSLYLFRSIGSTRERNFKHLMSPFGQNVATLLLTSQKARQTASKFFEGTGYRLKVDSGTQAISIAREIDDTLISFPYEAASETLRRMIFYSLAFDTNENRTLLLDEPEAHSFPPYTKTLAERIALDDRGNQFFLTTHSPYMLDSLLSKTPAKDLNVVLCRMENFETKAYPLNQEQIDQIKEWSMDAFFNFDRLLPEVK